jgi:hypothetical protein
VRRKMIPAIAQAVIITSGVRLFSRLNLGQPKGNAPVLSVT